MTACAGCGAEEIGCWVCDEETDLGDVNEDRLEQEDFGVYMESR